MNIANIFMGEFEHCLKVAHHTKVYLIIGSLKLLINLLFLSKKVIQALLYSVRFFLFILVIFSGIK
jgi:hypothetical protein